MMDQASQGRVFRRCACRRDDGQQFGAECPRLSESAHGSWYFSVSLPSPYGGRETVRRGGFERQREARAELDTVKERYRAGVVTDYRQTLAEYLDSWLAEQANERKPSTLHGYRRYVERDIVPAIGWVRLQALHPDHVARLLAELQQAGRGAVTIRRIHACLSSALARAVKLRKLAHNPAAHAQLPKATQTERKPWNAQQLVAFLAEAAGDPFGALFETLAGCGLRRGEALALRWCDVDLDARLVRVRASLTTVGGRTVTTLPKTSHSAATIGVSERVAAALRAHAASTGADVDGGGLVFPSEDGGPIRPERVLRRLRSIAKRAGVPEIRVHDLRHGCATLLLSEGVPLVEVSKTLRHAKTSITSDLYAHLLDDRAVAVSDTLGKLLDAAQAESAAESRMCENVATDQNVTVR